MTPNLMAHLADVMGRVTDLANHQAQLALAVRDVVAEAHRLVAENASLKQQLAALRGDRDE